MRARIVFGVAVVGCALATAVAAQGTGRSLDIQPGARQNGLGAAGVALVGDASDALWWNPAGLALAESQAARYTYAKLVPGLANDVAYHYGSAGVPIGKRFGIGGSATFLTFGSAGGATGQSGPSEWSWAAAAGYRILPDLAAGLTVKYVEINVAPASQSGQASTIGFDVGGLYRKTLAPVTLSAGANVQNLGPDVTFANEDQSSPLSQNLKVGGAALLPMPLGTEGFEVGATAVVDYNQSLVTDNFTTWNYGAEVYGGHARWGRAAFRCGYYDDPEGQIQDATWGAGIRILGVTVDYAAIPQAKDANLPRVEKWTVGIHTDLLLDRLGAR